MKLNKLKKEISNQYLDIFLRVNEVDVYYIWNLFVNNPFRFSFALEDNQTIRWTDSRAYDIQLAMGETTIS